MEECGRDILNLIPPERLDPLIAGGFLAVTEDRVLATPAGRQRLNAVLAALLG